MKITAVGRVICVFLLMFSSCGGEPERVETKTQAAGSSDSFMELLGKRSCYGFGGSCSSQATKVVMQTQEGSGGYSRTDGYRYCGVCARGHLRLNGTTTSGLYKDVAEVVPSKINAGNLEGVRRMIRD